MLDYTILASGVLAIYTVFEARRSGLRRLIVKFSILLAYYMVFGVVVKPLPLVKWGLGLAAQYMLTLTVGFLCSVSVLGFTIPFCPMLGIYVKAMGLLPLILAVYEASAVVTHYWSVFFTIGLLVYITDEDAGLTLLMTPIVAYLIGLTIGPIPRFLNAVNTPAYVTHIESTMWPTWFNGTYSSNLIVGITNDTAYTSSLIAVNRVVYLWLSLNYTVYSSCLRLFSGFTTWSICRILINNNQPFHTLNCPSPCGAWLILWSNATPVVTLSGGNLTIILKPIRVKVSNRTITYNTTASLWYWVNDAYTNCSIKPGLQFTYTPINLTGLGNVAYVNTLYHVPYTLPNPKPLGYIQGSFNYTTPNASCFIRLIGNRYNQWFGNATLAYTPYAAWWIGSLANSSLVLLVDRFMEAGVIAVIAGVTIEALTFTGLLRRLITLISGLT
ncbi:hypothetical protein [Caldivirga sp.]|uniref:hypothetical protein n=1 Tax=Caldivirga sp. TaxID=2080243 RepID=UPI003D0B7FF9